MPQRKTEHTWAKIRHPFRDGWFWVSLDAHKVDGRRHWLSPKEARDLATSLGGRLPTPGELDARFLAAGLHNPPHAKDITNKSTWPSMSTDIDADIATHQAEYGEPYKWIVGNAGLKHWVDYPKDEPRLTAFRQLRPNIRALYGGHYTVHTKHLAYGIPLHPSETSEDLLVIQRPWDTSHTDVQRDYAETGVFARDTPPDTWVELDEWGNVSTMTRDDELFPKTKQLPDTRPLRLRALDWSLSMVGHKESPAGSNTSPLIDAWAERCTRKGSGMGPLWNAWSGQDWCAVFATGGAHGEVALPGDVAPCGNRVSGSELIADAKARGTYVDPDELFAGLYEMRPGDVIVYKRLGAGQTKWTWFSHVCRFIEWADRSEWRPRTVGGNEGNEVRISDTRTLRDAPGLWGVIRYVENSGETAIPPGSEPVPESEAPTLPSLMRGVDISKHQRPELLDYEAIGRDFEFAYVRATYGEDPDPSFVEHVRKLRAVGVKVGAYAFVRQTQTADAQAAMLIQQMHVASMGPGDLCPMLDIEGNNGSKVKGDDGPVDMRLEAVARDMAAEMILRFVRVGIYTERDIWEQLGEPGWMLELPLWTSWPAELYGDDPWPSGQWAIWQHHHGKGSTYPDSLDQNYARELPRIES